MAGRRPLLAVRHVPWEGPHRILDAFAGRAIREVGPLDSDDRLPDVEEVCGAVFMGGPMSVNDTERYPRLAAEIAWIEGGIAAGMPILGVCLGAQLIARALGAEVRPGSALELGWAPVEIEQSGDPLLGALAPRATVLHWHGEAFDLPPGATPLARSALTACQAFRAGYAWGVLFHAEADAALVDRWLEEPSMAAEAEEVLGPEAATRLRAGAVDAEPDLLPASGAMFAAFASLTTQAINRPPGG